MWKMCDNEEQFKNKGENARFHLQFIHQNHNLKYNNLVEKIISNLQIKLEQKF